MNLKSRINSIERKLRELATVQSDSVIIETGVCVFDDTGNIDKSLARKIRVPKEQADSIGVLLVPRQKTKDEFRQQQITARSF